MGVICYWCKKEIPAERLEALPETDTCIECSRVKPVMGVVQGAGHMGSTKDYALTIFERDNKLVQSFVKGRKSRGGWGSKIGGNNLKGAGSFLK